MLYEPDQEDYDKLIALAYTFCRFGKIHPFLDSNGHVQRAVFAVMATEFDFPLSPRFVIHPRPFDRLLAGALEMFGRASADEEQEELGLVAEYLAFFLDGPFNSHRFERSGRQPHTSAMENILEMNESRRALEGHPAGDRPSAEREVNRHPPTRLRFA